MFKSLRWRLQVWHAVVLLVVLTSFGVIVYDLQWKTQLQQIDADLNRTMGLMFQRPRPPGRPLIRRPRDRDEVRPEGETDPRPGQIATSPQESPNSAMAPDKTNGPIDPPRPPRDRPNRDPMALLAEFEHLPHRDEDSRPYLVIWNEQGNVVVKSESAPAIDFPRLQPEADGKMKREIRERHDDNIYRELMIAGGYDRNLRIFLVGKSLENDLAAHHQAGLLLVVTGLVILAAGMLGGGWLSARAIRPIIAMTAAAESISAQNLSERINVKETDTELGKLATVLNATFDRLQAAFDRQSQFTADASHELRTPLSVIATHTELALSRPRSTEDYRAAIETCQRASQRMRSLIDALLILARFDSGTPSLNQESVDLAPLIHDCLELVRPLTIDRGIELECQTSACHVVGDWDRLAQVVTNLLTNAIRYNVDAGRVLVSTRLDEGTAVISVVDSGIGIAADQLPHIFDRFYQVDKARSRAEGSCGLGLAICKTIVQAHGGTISAASQRDTGTTIEVRLPLSERQAPIENANSLQENLVPVAQET